MSDGVCQYTPPAGREQEVVTKNTTYHKEVCEQAGDWQHTGPDI